MLNKHFFLWFNRQKTRGSYRFKALNFSPFLEHFSD
jgi:hypothetical protein